MTTVEWPDAGTPPDTGVLIINLATAKDRMDFQDAQMARLGLSATRVDAVTKADVSKDQLAAFSKRSMRNFRPVELACLLSHAKGWQATVAAGKPMLVVEDDVVLADELPAVIDALAEAASDRVVNLETYLDRPKILSRRPRPEAACDPMRLFSVIKGSAGAAAYVIGPTVADKMLTSLTSRTAIVELVLGLQSGSRNLQVVPALAAQMMTLDLHYCAHYGSVAASTILTDQEKSERPDQRRRARLYWRHPRFALRRLRLELRVAMEKLEGRFFGQSMVIQPSASLLARAKGS